MNTLQETPPPLKNPSTYTVPVQALISVRNITRVYAPQEGVPVRALDGVSVDILAGEFVAITGHSGSGKSTLLHQIGLLDEPTSGSIFIDGKNVAAFTEAERTKFRLLSLSFVFQFFNLIEHYTAIENIEFQLRLQGYSAYESLRKSHEILNFLGLEGRADLLPRELSGGEQQRIAIGRAIAKDSLVLIADEPTAHLDSKNAVVVIDLLKHVNEQFGKTIVLVTHEPEEAKQADRIIELRDGKVVSGHSGMTQT